MTDKQTIIALFSDCPERAIKHIFQDIITGEREDLDLNTDSLSALEISRVVNYIEEAVYVYEFCELKQYNNSQTTKVPVKPAINGFSVMINYSVGGSEGEGETVERVVDFSDADTGEHICYIRFAGYYCSYEGTSWYDFIQKMFAKEVVVTKYFPI